MFFWLGNIIIIQMLLLSRLCIASQNHYFLPPPPPLPQRKETVYTRASSWTMETPIGGRTQFTYTLVLVEHSQTMLVVFFLCTSI